ncbi:MAG TPA: response regulator transcription factor [Streptosporangiaceae bacterium]|nr:response regulator transcription factor [Streptosporangiaceae bacterium]
MSNQPGPLRVLIADDHAPTRHDVRRALDADGRFEVCAEVADAAEAVRAAVDTCPDVCLLDVRMPGSGVAAAWEIGARLPQAKIVMLTVSEEDADLFAALRAGADGYLLKTMNLRRLGEALEGVWHGEAAMPRALVARVLGQFHGREPRWRSLAGDGVTQRRLTSREWEVLELLAQGCSTAKIADRLVLSASAVRAHITAIVRKLEVADREGAIRLFRQRKGH